MSKQWRIQLPDGKLIGVFPASFDLNPYCFALLLRAYHYATCLPFMKN